MRASLLKGGRADRIRSVFSPRLNVGSDGRGARATLRGRPYRAGRPVSPPPPLPSAARGPGSSHGAATTTAARAATSTTTFPPAFQHSTAHASARLRRNVSASAGRDHHLCSLRREPWPARPHSEPVASRRSSYLTVPFLRIFIYIFVHHRARHVCHVYTYIYTHLLPVRSDSALPPSRRSSAPSRAIAFDGPFDPRR